MMGFDPTTAVWGFGLVQFLGLLSAALARYAAGSNSQASFQRLFFAFFALVGLTTMPALLWGPGPCLVSGTTISAMVLTATWDVSALR